MPVASSRPWRRSSVVLVLLWIATGVLVLAAHLTHPASRIRLDVSARTIGFTLTGEADQLLLSTTPLESLTIAGFERITPQSRDEQSIAGVSGSSVTLKRATLEGISAPRGTNVRVNKEAGDPGVRMTLSRGAARGTVQVPADAAVRCYRCGDEAAAGWLLAGESTGRSPLVWTSRAQGGGTDVLLRGPDELVISNDDLRIEGDFDLSESDGRQLISTLHAGTLEFPGAAAPVKLEERARLAVDIQPGTGVIKKLTVHAAGVSAVMEGRATRVSLETAGQRDELLPSYLEIVFHSKSWLLLAQAVILIGGTLARIFAFMKKGDTP